MKLHELAPAPGARRDKRRVGRGDAGTGGTYAGRGVKGQHARSGGVKGAYFEGGQLPFVRRMPFKRGFTNIFKVYYAPVNIGTLDASFEAGADVTPAALAEMGLLRSSAEPYRVLGDGALSKPLNVHAMGFSGTAKSAIEAAGGSCHALEYERPRLKRRHKRH